MPAFVAVAALVAVVAAACGPTPPESGRRALERVMPSTFVTPGDRLGLAGCPVFPRNNAFHATISGLPAAPSSGATIAAAGGAGLPIMAGFGSGVWMGSRLGWPTNVVDARTAPRNQMIVSFAYAHMSDMSGVPWPSQPRFEGWPGRSWDKHLEVLDSSTCTSWELINVQPPWENYYGGQLGMWYADAIVALDLRSNEFRRGGTVTAAGLSMLATLTRFDEVASGRIDHVLSISLPNIRAGAPAWPAQGSDGRSADPASPPMGTWLRLKDGVDVDRLPPQARVVARALQEHGAVVTDTGPNAAIGGEPDVRWNDADLGSLRSLTLGDFEVVDPTPMRADATSLAIR